MISLVLSGRNDNYGGCFEERLFYTLECNVALLERCGIDFEIIFVEWNPLQDRPCISKKICEAFPRAQAYVVPPAIHDVYSTNPHMGFFEMPAKNIGIRYARGDFVLVLNADILLTESIVEGLCDLDIRERVLYRARRIDIQALDFSQAESDQRFEVIGNGENAAAPVRYLGAGGDFCLARKSTFLEIGGFDERARFTTRAKDWQFYLSALSRGVAIEFVGDVYHIDHDEGFRNTSSDLRDTDRAHFGSFWNFELELPYQNPENWGLQGMAFEQGSIESVRFFRVPVNVRGRWDGAADELLRARSLPANEFSGFKGAQMMHLLLQREVSDAVQLKLSQPDSVGQWKLLNTSAEKGIALSMDTNEPAIEEHAHALVVNRGDVTFPDTIDAPTFNPFLLNRLLKAYRFFQERGLSRVLLYGAGLHTSEVLKNGIPEGIQIVGVLESSPNRRNVFALDCYAPDEVSEDLYDAVLLSSISYETELEKIARSSGLKNVYSLYGEFC